MHEHIRRFTQDGRIRDNTDFIRLKDMMRINLEDRMRSDGYVPQLDCGLHWSTEYFPEDKCYGFKITLYGVYVGKKRACEDAIAYYEGKVHGDC
jgi:hypothetical protein